MSLKALRRMAPLGMAVAFAAAVAQTPSPFPAIAPGQARLDGTIHGLDGPGFAIAYGEESGTLAAAGEHGAIQFWPKDVLMGIRLGDGAFDTLKGHTGPVIALAWNGDPLLASAGADRKILIWNLADGRVAHTLDGGGVVRALALAPDGKSLASAGDDPAVRLWDPATGKAGARLEGHTDWVLCLAFSADGKQIASGGHDGVVRVWDVAQAKKLLEIPSRPAMPPNAPTASVHSLAFSPDGKQLAVGGSDGLIHLASTVDGKIARTMAGHTSTVTALAFHPSGTVLASGSKDDTVRLWNPANGQPLKVLEGHTAWVQGLTFLARGTRLASAGADQTVRLWDLSSK